MSFNLGEKMRTLRKSRDLTQEQLAEFLGVTFQSVSKWETNSAYPDISLFPIIANFYGVTTDELLGVDITKSDEKVKAYYSEMDDLYQSWKYKEIVELCRKACYEFPGNLGLKYHLAWSLGQAQSVIDTKEESLNEAIIICKSILNLSQDTTLKLKTTSLLCYLYHWLGDDKQALVYTDQLPYLGQTKQYLIGRLGLKKGKEQVEYALDCIHLYSESLSEVIEQFADSACVNKENSLSYHEKIDIYKQLIVLYDVIYGDNKCDKHFEVYNFKRIIACFYLLNKDFDNTLLYLEKAYDEAELFENYVDEDHYSSVFLKRMKGSPHIRWSRRAFEDMLDRLTNQKRYDVIRDDSRFIDTIEKLKVNCIVN